jgi:hypothetical protein
MFSLLFNDSFASADRLHLFCARKHVTSMIGFQLLILVAEGQFRAKELARQIAGRATKDTDDDVATCAWDRWTGTEKLDEIGELISECCALSVQAPYCQASAAVCQTHPYVGSGNVTILVWGDEAVDGFCKQWCKDWNEDWCPTGLSVGAIVGIVLGSIAGVAIIAIIVWIIVRCRHRGDNGEFSLFP